MSDDTEVEHGDDAVEHSWNHRVMRHKGEGEDYLAIHEVHYEDDVPRAWTVEPVHVGGEDIEVLRWTLERMLTALDQPVLDFEREEPCL